MDHTHLFEYAKDVISSQSGDGTVLIVSQNCRKLADRFLAYETSIQVPKLVLSEEYVYDNRTYIAFFEEIGGEEALVFSNDWEGRDNEMYDCIIILADHVE